MTWIVLKVSLNPNQPTKPQTASWSVQPFLQGTSVTNTDGQTHTKTDRSRDVYMCRIYAMQAMRLNWHCNLLHSVNKSHVFDVMPSDRVCHGMTTSVQFFVNPWSLWYCCYYWFVQISMQSWEAVANWLSNRLQRLVAWHTGRTSVFGWRTFPVLQLDVCYLS